MESLKFMSTLVDRLGWRMCSDVPVVIVHEQSSLIESGLYDGRLCIVDDNNVPVVIPLRMILSMFEASMSGDEDVVGDMTRFLADAVEDPSQAKILEGKMKGTPYTLISSAIPKDVDK